MTVPRTNPVKRLFCRAMSPLPSRADCWQLRGDTLTVNLEKAAALKASDSALRLEDERLPDRILVVHGVDDRFYAYANRCACAGFRVDPVPGERKIRCCTLMQSTYDYEGNMLSGSARTGLTVYPVESDGDTLRIDLASPTVAKVAIKD